MNPLKFENGDLWFSTVSREAASASWIRPIMDKSTLGGAIPFVSLSVRNAAFERAAAKAESGSGDAGPIFDSAILPYENIIAFEYEAMKSGGTLTIIDSSMALLESILRLAVEDAGKYKFLLDFGWMIDVGSLTNESKVKLSALGIVPPRSGTFRLSYGEFPIIVSNVVYDWTPQGVIFTISFFAASRGAIGSAKVSSDAFKAPASPFSSDVLEAATPEQVGKKLSEYISNAIDPIVGNGVNVIINAEGVEVDEAIRNCSITDETTCEKLLAEVVDYFKVRADEKREPLGRVIYYISDKKKDDAYDIYIYYQEKASDQAAFYPHVVFPALESPIRSFTPKLKSNMLVTKQRITGIGTDGRGNQVSRNTESKSGRLTQVNGVTEVTQANTTKGKEGAPTRFTTLAEIDMDFLGNPLWFGTDVIGMRLVVENPTIQRQGFFREENLADNLRQINPSQQNPLRALLPSAIGQGLSPFDGYYIVMSLTHKISVSEGFTTSVGLVKTADLDGIRSILEATSQTNVSDFIP